MRSTAGRHEHRDRDLHDHLRQRRLALDRGWLHGRFVVRAVALEADQHLVEEDVVEDGGPGVARELLGHEPRAGTAAIDERGDPVAPELAKRGVDGEAARSTRELGHPVGLVALVYGLVEAPTAGWASAQTVVLFAISLILFGTFAAIERGAKEPLVPRRLVASRTLLAANLGLGLTAASIYGMAFIVSLYGQEVLGYSALRFGIAAVVLPIGVALGAGIGQALITRRGTRAVSAAGITGLAVGFVLLARLPVHGSYTSDLLPGFVLFGVPLGLAFTAYSVATLTGVATRDAGLASGLNNTFEQVGGAIGTALMASIATARTGDLLHAGAGHLFALDRGIQLAFATAIAFPVLGLVVSLFLLRQSRSAAVIEPPRGTASAATGAE